MKPNTIFFSNFLITVLTCFAGLQVFSQTETPSENLPKDYLTIAFHAGRRQALRDLMPSNSVAVIFSYPEEIFSKDVDYFYHPNPDLYYFSGYKEPNSVLLIFKENQSDAEGSYNELFFVQHRDARSEQWTGKRLGVEGVKSKLGFKRVYNSEAFGNFPVDLKKFNSIYDGLQDTCGNLDSGSIRWLVASFVRKGDVKPIDKNLAADLNVIYRFGSTMNLPRILMRIKPRLNTDAYKNDSLIQELMAKPDSATLEDFKKKYGAMNTGTLAFNRYTNQLRGIKTTEELVLLKKSVEISGIAHKEAMKAVKSQISERELEGIMLYVHKKYGAEDEGYPPIVGAGANGCILHYEENNALEVKNQLVLMDVGAEYHGYSADITRTFPANGKFTDQQKAIYEIVYKAQEEVFKLCHPGTPFDSLQEKSKQVIAAGLIRLGLIKDPKDVSTYYPHSVSHHLGLDVHDKGDYKTLEGNMVITVEPGIYIPSGSACDKKWWNIGVRIEDDVLIQKNSYILLSAAAPRKWQEVEKTIAEKSFFDAAVFPEIK
jgi:Xaa-Pro aminopeptidase